MEPLREDNNHTLTSSLSNSSPSSTTSSSASQQLQHQQQVVLVNDDIEQQQQHKSTQNNNHNHYNKQNDILMEKFGINMISLFADIHNAIVDSTADCLESIEARVKVLHLEYCNRKGIGSEQIAREQELLASSFDNIQFDSAKETAVSVDMAEVFAAGTVFALREYMDSNVIKSIYGDLALTTERTERQQQQQQQQQQGTTADLSVDEEQINREILELRRQIQHEQRRNQVLKEEGMTLNNETKFFEQNIDKFNFLEQIQREEEVESWDKLVTDLITSGKTLHRRILESKKQHQESDAMEIDEQLTAPSAFNSYTSTTSITFSGESDLNQLMKHLNSGK